MMNNPRTRHLPRGKKKAPPPATNLIFGSPDGGFVKAVETYNSWIRETLGEASTFDVVQVNPLRIIQCAPESPYHAAVMCQNACFVLASGHHARVHDYMIAAYVIALALKKNDLNASFVASKVKDGRSGSEGIPKEKFKADILHYLFVFIFAQSKLVKRNRAWQWADSLQAYFDDDRDPAEVEGLLRSHGQNNLRIAAHAAKNERKAQQRKLIGSGSLSEHVDAILAETEEDPDAVAPLPTSAEDKVTKVGSRDLPPSEQRSDGDSGSYGLGDEGEEDGDEEIESGEGEASIDNEHNSEDFVDGEAIIERLHAVLIGMMNVSAQLVEPDIGTDRQRRLLPLMLLLSNEIVDLQRMLRGR